MCAIAYYLESEGIMTTGISLVRENAEALQPPRMLWVPFPLGRPLGAPHDPEFQTQVIESALALLDRPDGPVLEDFPHDAPEADAAPFVCPVSFAKPEDGATSWTTRLQAEIALLEPWYELGKARRQRTTVRASPSQLAHHAALLGQALEADVLDAAGLPALKQAIEDLKAFCQEALTAQPGVHDWQAVRHVLWYETALGAALRELHARCQADDALKGFGVILVPRTVLHDE